MEKVIGNVLSILKQVRSNVNQMPQTFDITPFIVMCDLGYDEMDFALSLDVTEIALVSFDSRLVTINDSVDSGYTIISSYFQSDRSLIILGRLTNIPEGEIATLFLAAGAIIREDGSLVEECEIPITVHPV